jgi:tetratricopeptide (TPR) repeat protein
LVVAVLAGTFAAHQFIEYVPPAERSEVYLPKPELAKIAALGFDSAIADYYWIQAMYVVGAARRDPTRFAPYIGKIIDVVTTLDPWVDHPYRFAAIWLTDSQESVRAANRLLRRSFEYHPSDWRNRFYLGFNHFFYLGENAEAAEAIEEAVELPGSPRYLPRLVARLRSESADIDAASVFLLQLLEEAPDEAARAEYQDALDEIEVERHARELDRARAAYRKLAGSDVTSAEELVIGETPVLDELPPPWPSSLPRSMQKGFTWSLDPDKDAFVSSYYRRRYELTFHSEESARRERWFAESPDDLNEEAVRDGE